MLSYQRLFFFNIIFLKKGNAGNLSVTGNWSGIDGELTKGTTGFSDFWPGTFDLWQVLKNPTHDTDPNGAAFF